MKNIPASLLFFGTKGLVEQALSEKSQNLIAKINDVLPQVDVLN